MKKRRAERVVLITLDGLRPEYYLDARWPAPAMQQLYREGAHAKAVKSIFPPETYPAHVTLATGALPAQHGVYHDRHTEPRDNPPFITDASMIRVPALWDAVRAAGGTTAAIGWPVSKGAAIDWNLPDMWPGEEKLFLDAIRGAATPGLYEELEREATGRLTLENFSNRSLAHDLRIAAMAAYLFERYRPTLLLAHAQATVQVPQEPGWNNPRRARAIAASDQIASMVLDVIERTKAWDSTALIVTGDHGMTEVHSQIRPNIWLERAGLSDRAWFHALGGAAFLRVHDPNDVDAVRRVLDDLPPAKRAIFRIVEREELDALGSDPEAPFALAAIPGFVIDSRIDGEDLRPNPGMSHGHHPDEPDLHTGFVAKGAGIRAGACAPVLPLTAIAPLVAELLGLEFEGVVYSGLLV